MMIVNSALNAAAAVLASLLVAALLCWLGWEAFKLVSRPEWGPPLAPAVLIAASAYLIEHDFMIQASLFCALIASAVWCEGKAWRARKAGSHHARERVERMVVKGSREAVLGE